MLKSYTKEELFTTSIRYCLYSLRQFKDSIYSVIAYILTLTWIYKLNTINMKLIKSKVEIIEQEPSLEGIYKQIELAGRTCYKSEDKITSTSAKEFVDRMIGSGHGAVLEHGTVYLFINTKACKRRDYYFWQSWIAKKYSKVKKIGCKFYITTNLRVLVENNKLDDLRFLCEPTEYHEKRISVRFTCDRGVSHEIVRHRVYSNYTKDKFRNELTYIIPSWLEIPEGNYTYWDGDWVDIDKMKIQLPSDDRATDNFLWVLHNTELMYRLLTNKNWKPQQARAILPNALKTEIVVTGFESDWEHFFELRCAKSAHPDMRVLALDLLKQLHEKYPSTFNDLYKKYYEKEGSERESER